MPAVAPSLACNDALEEVESQIAESRSKGGRRTVSGQARPL
jgi:hypothetical protein